jgi:hypothetical protein
MTTFTSEDREAATQFKWSDYQVQQEIKFFWPLTEQVELDLDYAPTRITYPFEGSHTIGLYCLPTNSTILNAPQLVVEPQNTVGYLSIGGINMGMDKEPKWYRKLLFKLLGFNWKDK